MARSKETGHQINANNFVETVHVVERHKTEYKPTNPAIQLEVIKTAETAVSAVIGKVSGAKTNSTKAISKRRIGYIGMKKLVKRVVHMFNSCEVTVEEKQQVKSLYLKFKSVRIGKVPDEEALKAEAAASGTEAKVPTTYSVSQQGFIDLLGHFNDIIVYLKTIPAYKPAEEDLTIVALELVASSLKTLNEGVSDTESILTGVRKERNVLLYKDNTGGCDIADTIAEYVEGATTKDSLFYAELKKYPMKKFKG